MNLLHAPREPAGRDVLGHHRWRDLDDDRERVARYHDDFKRLGSYPYDQDPLRPGWAPLIPNSR